MKIVISLPKKKAKIFVKHLKKEHPVYSKKLKMVAKK